MTKSFYDMIEMCLNDMRDNIDTKEQLEIQIDVFNESVDKTESKS